MLSGKSILCRCCICSCLALVAVLVLAFFLLHAVLVLISPNYCRYKSSYSYIGSWGLSVSCPCLVLAIAPVLACVLAWCFALFLVLFHVLVLILLQVILPNKTTIYFVQNRILSYQITSIFSILFSIFCLKMCT